MASASTRLTAGSSMLKTTTCADATPPRVYVGTAKSYSMRQSPRTVAGILTLVCAILPVIFGIVIVLKVKGPTFSC
ncbi:hypothetical protein CTRI78_v000180 [Colletotrichum trifolii]|uniref:Uncharacterized protein n=1 Tax=Colletotrichum trifolii TaxID=5466 RepID=A0A4R8RTA4_COLTR|nr:hypothetical protein CTRI78_v000180 [Colletotrichum trifolii]